MRNNLFLGVAAAALVMPMAAYAQETTSTIRGTVTSSGAPVAGATVEVTDANTGTLSTVVTGESGSFSVGGLRPGGPYTVSVTAEGFGSAQVTEITTVVAQAFDVPIELTADTATAAADDIVVTASRLPGARSVSQGPATVLDARAVQNVASVNHDIRDLVRRDPFARLDDTPGGGRAVSFAGQNARFNRFSVDGVPITDNFGLNTDGLPSRRSPIPLDAIGQFQAKVAPYDIREGNFQGGAINIVLKSGTNTFHGTGFFAYSADELTGTKTKAGPGVPAGRVTLPNFEIKNYGVQLEGPLIKDKLFFMVAGERYRAARPIAEGPIDNNAGTQIPTLTQSQVDRVSQIARDRYNGYETGGVLNDNGDKDDRVVARLDANLSDTQRFSLTGTYAKDTIALLNNTNTNTTTPQLGLASDAYLLGNKLYTAVGQLNSEWSDAFSTEVRGFYKDYTRIQTPYLGLGFGQFRVCTAPTSDRTVPGAPSNASTNCPVGFSQVTFGPDISRQANQLKTSTWGVSTVSRLTLDDHDLRILAEYNDTRVFNLFLQSVAGNYYFDSLADLNARTAQSLSYGNAVPSLDPNDAAAKFKYQLYTFGVQDNWRISDILTFTYGFRYDLYGGNSTPVPLSPSFQAKYGYPNTNYINGLQMFQPRFGFDFRPARTLQVRGGLGIFAGGTPDVYVSNSFSNTGVLSNNVTFTQANSGVYSGNGGVPLSQADGAAILTNVNGGQIAQAANTYLLAASGNIPTNTASRSTVNALDPNFIIPSQWRGTLSVDWTPEFDNFLGGGWDFGADFFYSTVRKQVYFTDIRSVPLTGPNALTPDGRLRYTAITNAINDTNQDILLTNTAKGRSYVAVARVSKTFDWGLDAGVSFTYQDIKDQTPATSSTAGSNYSNGAFIDNNTVDYATSNDQVKYQIKYNLTFDHAFVDDYKTTFALFGETRAGRPFSWTVVDRPAPNTRSAVWGGSGGSSRFLAYIPLVNDPLVSYATQAQADQLNAFIDANGLAKYRGKIAPRNAFRSKWFTRFDLHLAQELPTFVEGSKIQVFADIENVTNLINKNWGQIREYVFPYTNPLAEVQCLAAPTPTGVSAAGVIVNASTQPCAQYRYLPPQQGATTVTPATDTIYSSQSLYAIRAGVRFSF